MVVLYGWLCYYYNCLITKNECRSWTFLEAAFSAVLLWTTILETILQKFQKHYNIFILTKNEVVAGLYFYSKKYVCVVCAGVSRASLHRRPRSYRHLLPPLFLATLPLLRLAWRPSMPTTHARTWVYLFFLVHLFFDCFLPTRAFFSV